LLRRQQVVPGLHLCGHVDHRPVYGIEAQFFTNEESVMASGRRPRRRLTENDRELAKGAMVLAIMAVVVAVVYYWMGDATIPAAR
jgi:hypothetical protein